MSGERVHVLGVGMTRFGKLRDQSPEQLGATAVLRALDDAQTAPAAIDEAFCGSSFSGMLIGQRVLRDLGMTGIPITNVENACSGGATALREAVSAVQSGRATIALAIGVDSLTALGSGTLPLNPNDIEVNAGMVMPALYAMRAQRYLHETETTRRGLAMVSVKARRNGARNEYAQLRDLVTEEQVLESRPIADPLSLLMCCPTGDGAAAAVVSSTRGSRSRPDVTVAASILQSGRVKEQPGDLSFSELTAQTAALAYEAAGIGPQDLGVVELHDAFSIAELMYYDALGLSERGGAHELLERGDTEIGGRIPVNTGGGLLSRGHPVGATGLAQVCEVFWQLTGTAAERQIPERPTVALTHCTGGGIAGLDHGACAMHVFTT